MTITSQKDIVQKMNTLTLEEIRDKLCKNIPPTIEDNMSYINGVLDMYVIARKYIKSNPVMAIGQPIGE